MTCSRTPGDFDVTVHGTQDLAAQPEPTAPATMSGRWAAPSYHLILPAMATHRAGH
jgi:hypothetical protein